MDSGSRNSKVSNEEDKQRVSHDQAVPPPMPRRTQRQQRSVMEEEMPEYRSVMISRNFAPPSPLSFSSPVSTKQSAGMMQTTIASNVTSGSYFSPPLRVVAVDTFLSQWGKCPPTPLPRNYPLERTHVRIEGAVPASTVTERICQTVKDLSLASSRNEDEDQVRIVGHFPLRSKFCINRNWRFLN